MPEMCADAQAFISQIEFIPRQTMDSGSRQVFVPMRRRLCCCCTVPNKDASASPIKRMTSTARSAYWNIYKELLVCRNNNLISNEEFQALVVYLCMVLLLLYKTVHPINDEAFRNEVKDAIVSYNDLCNKTDAENFKNFSDALNKLKTTSLRHSLSMPTFFLLMTHMSISVNGIKPNDLSKYDGLLKPLRDIDEIIATGQMPVPESTRKDRAMRRFAEQRLSVASDSEHEEKKDDSPPMAKAKGILNYIKSLKTESERSTEVDEDEQSTATLSDKSASPKTRASTSTLKRRSVQTNEAKTEASADSNLEKKEEPKPDDKDLAEWGKFSNVGFSM